ncbi:uncharacterized protein LOC134179568 [Corticium candelabrum]|uniref:uncharacterized protein LOC134179568 n=1 Tax=Corticium candelabrum TaxID=121492 RepID=UPI002E265DCD|nr:uncharacterized protein LOC134179568 [Corticium candelabrum]
MEAEIESGLTVVSAVVMPPENDIVQMVIRNESSFTHRLSQEETVGVIETEGVLDAPLDVESSGYLTINMVSGDSFEQRKEELLHSLTLPDLLQDELKQLEDFLVDHHNVFSLGNAYMDDILVYSRALGEHLDYLKLVLVRLRSANIKLKPSKCEFVRPEVEYLGHVITAKGLKVCLRLTSAVIGIFTAKFEGVAFEWSADCEHAFKSLKERLTAPPVLSFPLFNQEFTLETDASTLGLGAILSQLQADGKLYPFDYVSRALNEAEINYSISKIETLAVVWTISHFFSYLYGNRVTVLTDHSAVKAILETPNPTGKHARWWTKVYGRGVKVVVIKYRAGRNNVSADALSRSLQVPHFCVAFSQGEFQIAMVQSDQDIRETLRAGAIEAFENHSDYTSEQRKDPQLKENADSLSDGHLPEDANKAKIVALQESLFVLIDEILYYVEHKITTEREK